MTSKTLVVAVPARYAPLRGPLQLYLLHAVAVMPAPVHIWWSQACLQEDRRQTPALRVQVFRPVLSTRQAGMPALLGSVLSVDSVSSVDSECSVPSQFSEEFCCPRNWREGESGRRAFVKLTGEGGREEKSFFAKRTHWKTSDIQLTNCNIRRYEICRRLGIGFVIGFVLLRKAVR